MESPLRNHQQQLLARRHSGGTKIQTPIAFTKPLLARASSSLKLHLSQPFSSSSSSSASNPPATVSRKCPTNTATSSDQPLQLQLLHIPTPDNLEDQPTAQGFAQDTLDTFSTLMGSQSNYSSLSSPNGSATQSTSTVASTAAAISLDPSSLSAFPPTRPLSPSTILQGAAAEVPTMLSNSPIDERVKDALSSSPSHLVFPPVGPLPLVVRDKRRYGSLDAAALEDQGALKSVSAEDARPLSSMEDAEEGSTTTTVSTTDTVATSRRALFDEGQVQLAVAPTPAVIDQVGISNATAVSNDQQSIHPLQLNPEPRLTFASSPLLQINTSLSNVIAHPPTSPTASIDRWHLVSPLGSPTHTQQLPFVNTSFQQASAQKLRKKSTLASKIRKVFNKPIVSASGQNLELADSDMLQQPQALEDIISMSPRDDGASSSMFGQDYVPSSLLKNQRGSVSSTSSADTTMSAAPGEFAVITPSTSPEMSPAGSPKVRSLSLQLPPTRLASISGEQDITVPLNLVPIVEDATFEPKSEGIHKAGKRQNLEPIQTRTVKKRLSFASITSFFNPRSDELLAKATQKRDQRASSVPNVEHPLVIVGRQIAGFPRRHSLNDMQVGGRFHQKQEQIPLYKFVNPPWDKDGASAQAAAAAAELLASSSSKSKSNSAESNIASSEDASELTRKKSRIHSVFAKQSRRKSKSGPAQNAIAVEAAPDAANSTATALPARPLRSALVNRHQRQLSFKRTAQMNRTSIYGQSPIQFDHHSQGATAPSSRRHSLCEPLVDLSPDAGPTVSRRTSAEDQQQQQQQQQQQIRQSMERIVGPTRHRRQSSIASRHASQQGNYPAIERKPHRLSMRYSTSEEFDIFQYADAFAPVRQHPHYQQPQQFQQLQAQPYHYQGGYLSGQPSHDFDAFALTGSTSSAPRMFPVHQGEDAASFNGSMLSPMSFVPSRGSFSSASGAEAQSQQAIPGSGVGTGANEVQSPLTSGPTSKETSPELAASSSNLNGVSPAVKIVPRNPALANVMNHQHRRSSYQQGESPVTASNYSSKRNSLIVAPVSRLSVDHSLMMEPHQGFVKSVNSHHQYLQHQQQIQIQQQLHVQQQQFQRNQQQFQHHYLSDQHQQQQAQQAQQQQQQQQQFMNCSLPHSPPHASHIPLQEQPYHPHPYSPYQYQYNVQQQQQQQQQQSMSSHLHYPSSPQHATPYHPHAHSQAFNPGHMSMTSSSSHLGGNPYPNTHTNTIFRSSPSSPSNKTIHLARPTRQLQFSTAQPTIHTTWTSDQYDRTSDPNITAHRLTPAIAQKIKLELNQFKSQEMNVHQESRTHTHFFV
ncbi:unnamed protein product [Mortierella alpina]